MTRPADLCVSCLHRRGAACDEELRRGLIGWRIKGGVTPDGTVCPRYEEQRNESAEGLDTDAP